MKIEVPAAISKAYSGHDLDSALTVQENILSRKPKGNNGLKSSTKLPDGSHCQKYVDKNGTTSESLQILIRLIFDILNALYFAFMNVLALELQQHLESHWKRGGEGKK